MANETSFTLTFKTIADLTGLTSLQSGLEAGVAKVEAANARIATSATAAANGVLATFRDTFEGITRTRQTIDTNIAPPAPPDTRTAEEIARYEQIKVRVAEIAAARAGQVKIESAVVGKLSQEALIEEQLSLIAATRFELTEATINGDTARAAALRSELSIRLSTLGVMRSEVLSEGARASLLKEEAALLAVAAEKSREVAAGSLLAGANLNKAKGEALVLGREIAAGSVNARTLGAFLGSLGTVFTIGAIAGFEVFHIITETVHEIREMGREIEKNATSLAKNVVEWTKISRAAGDSGDIVHLAERIDSELNAASEKFNEFRNKQLTGWQSFRDQIAILIGFGDRPAGEDEETTGPIKAASDAAKEKDRELFERRLAQGNKLIDQANEFAATWQRIKIAPIDEGIAILTEKIRDLERISATLDQQRKAPANATPEDLAFAKRAFDQYTQVNAELKLWQDRLKGLTSESDKLDASVDKVAAELKKADFNELDSTGKLDALSADLTGIQEKLRAVGVEAASPNEALEKAKGLTKENADEVIKLAGAWGGVLAAISAVLNEQSKINAELGALKDKEAVLNATAYGTRDEAYKAEWGAKYNQILRDREKMGADTSAGAINAQIAAEERAAERRKEWSAEDRSAGKSADALTLARSRLSQAQDQYNIELERTKLLEDTGAISGSQANERKRAAAAAYLAELRQIDAEMPKLIAQQQALGNTQGVAQLQKEWDQVHLKELKVMDDIANTTTWGQIRSQIRQLANEWSNVGKQVGQFLTQQFQNFASTAGNAIGQLIFRTGNWKQSIVQLGQSFVSSLATMLIQWILSRTIMSALNKAFAAKDAVANGVAAAASAVAWAPAATAASIASSGAAAGSGLTAFLMAIAAGIAAIGGIGAGGGFQGGGFTGHGPENQRAGDVHFEEVVFPAPRVRELGRDWLVNLAVGSLSQSGYQRGGFGGGRPGSSGGGPSFGGAAQPVNVAFFDDRQALAEWLRSREGQVIIYDAINNRRMDLGI